MFFAIINILTHGGIRCWRLASLATELLEALHPRCATRTQACVHATHHVQTKTDSIATLAHAHCVQPRLLVASVRGPNDKLVDWVLLGEIQKHAKTFFAWDTVTLADI